MKNSLRIFICNAGAIALFAIGSWGQDVPDAAPEQPHPASDGPFSLFNFGKITSVGVSLCWFSYQEEYDLNEEIQNFTESYGYPPDAVIGAPKSTEHGSDLALTAALTLYSWRNRIFFRPKAGLVLGMGNSYDGSSQEQLIVDTASNPSACGGTRTAATRTTFSCSEART